MTTEEKKSLRRWNLKQREYRLLRAADDVLYWFQSLDLDLRGPLSGERHAIIDLQVALRQYEKHGHHFVTNLDFLPTPEELA